VADAEDHRHCKVCGKVTNPDREFCSKACRAQRDERIRSRRTLTYMMYGGIALLLVLLALNFLHA
jgi:predicted nucleic acid-binding Zn ribbon protein